MQSGIYSLLFSYSFGGREGKREGNFAKP